MVPILPDSIGLERERVITLEVNSVTLPHTAKDGKTFGLNLLDTPGHIDFSHEVRRFCARGFPGERVPAVTAVQDCKRSMAPSTRGCGSLARRSGSSETLAAYPPPLDQGAGEPPRHREQEHRSAVPDQDVLKV